MTMLGLAEAINHKLGASKLLYEISAAADIGKAKITTLIWVGQFRVIQTEQSQNGGVQIM
jgi:hypothetical protein